MMLDSFFNILHTFLTIIYIFFFLFGSTPVYHISQACSETSPYWLFSAFCGFTHARFFNLLDVSSRSDFLLSRNRIGLHYQCPLNCDLPKSFDFFFFFLTPINLGTCLKPILICTDLKLISGYLSERSCPESSVPV